MTPFRILLVEDFEPFRKLVRRTLERRPNLQVVGEAVDGVDAVRSAQRLQPDLILVDIGLPNLNGIAAAQQIRTLVPNAKLLFISLESSDATVRAAFSVGGNGYIHKLRTHIDLIPGVEAVLAGKRFVSGHLAVDANTKQLGRHELHFYSDDSAFVEIGARFIADALNADGAAIVFATPPHREDLLERLKENAFDMDNAIQSGVYIAVDAAETLSNAMVNSMLDDARAAEVVTSLVQTSMRARRSEQARIAIFSEWSALLCAEGNIPAAIQLESGGNGIVEHQPIDIVCAYPLDVLHRHNADRTFNRICAAHTAVFSH